MPALRAALAWLILPTVVAIAWLIAWLDRVIGFPLPFPRRLADLPGRSRPIAPTVAFRSDSGFVELEGEERFAKFAPTSGSITNRTFFNLQGNAGKEARFNAAWSADPSVPAPRAYFAKSDGPTGNLCLVTEKMTNAVEYREDQSISPEHLDAALDGLARLHARFWKRPSNAVEAIPRIVVDWFASLVLFSWSSAARSIVMRSWARMNTAQTVVHGDARVGNMLFGERFVLIDWQAVRFGIAAFDLAYFLTLSLSTERREEVEASALKTYHARLIAYGVADCSLEQLNEDYRHGVLCTLVLLALPLLSGEASADAQAALGFVYGMGLWRERMKKKLDTFDYAWVSSRYGISEGDAREAVAQMLRTIERRLEKIGRRQRA